MGAVMGAPLHKRDAPWAGPSARLLSSNSRRPFRDVRLDRTAQRLEYTVPGPALGRDVGIPDQPGESARLVPGGGQQFRCGNEKVQKTGVHRLPRIEGFGGDDGAIE